jgi:hypothetical protein
MEDMSVSLKGYPGELASSSFLSYFVSVNSSPALPPSKCQKHGFDLAEEFLRKIIIASISID